MAEISESKKSSPTSVLAHECLCSCTCNRLVNCTVHNKVFKPLQIISWCSCWGHAGVPYFEIQLHSECRELLNSREFSRSKMKLWQKQVNFMLYISAIQLALWYAPGALMWISVRLSPRKTRPSCSNSNWSVACINWVSRKKWIWENRHWSCGHENG